MKLIRAAKSNAKQQPAWFSMGLLTTKLISPLDSHLWWRSCLLLSWAKGVFPSSFHSQLGRSFQRCCPLLNQGLSPLSKCVSFVCSQVLCYLPSKQGTSSLNFPTDSTCKAASSLAVITAEGSHLFPPPPNVWRIHSTNAYLCLLYRGHRQKHWEERLAGCLKEDWLNLTLWLHPYLVGTR